MKGLIVSLWLAVLCVGAELRAQEASPSDLQLERLVRAEPNFRQILIIGLSRTQTMNIATYNLGVERRCELLRPLFDAAITAHLPQWRANLIAAYRQAVPVDVLTQAVEQNDTAAALTLAPYANTIGSQAQAANLPVLQEAMRTIVPSVGEAALEVDPGTVNRDARVAEVQAAMADRSILCGLVE